MSTTDPYLLADVALALPEPGYSDLAALTGELLTAPAGKAYVLVANLPWPGDALSVLADADPAAVAGDVIEHDTVTTPGGFPVTVFSDGTFLITGDNGSQQTFAYRLWREATATWAGPETVTVEGAAALTLSTPTVTAITATSATPRVTLTNAAAGTLHYAIYPSAASQPTFDGTVWSGAPVATGSEASNTVDGPQTFAAAATGLDASTPYRIAFAWTDGTDTSDVAWSDAWETLSAALELDLITHNATHANTTDAAQITAAHALTTANAAHAHTAEQTTLTSALSLVTAAATHANTTDAAQITAALTLVSANATHSHTATQPALNSGLALTSHDATHSHTVDHITLSALLALVTHHAQHGQLVDHVTLSVILALAFSGTVRDKNGALAARTVTALREATQTVVATTTSDAVTGEYHIPADFDEPHTLIFSGEADRNALVYSGVMPG